MSVKEIRAKIECEGCNKVFSVEIDPADDGPSAWDIAKEAVRGSVNVEFEGRKGADSTSVQGDLMLCPNCTSIVDNALREDDQPTKERVEEILDIAQVKREQPDE